MKYKRFLFFIGCASLAVSESIIAQNNGPYFYHGYSYGSEYAYNPVSTILIGGYSIFQVGNNSKRPEDVHYRTGWNNVWMNITHPAREIGKFGWKKFISTEIIPTSLYPKSAQYIPNYQDHLIGSGMQYRAMCEWYESRKFPAKRIFAFGTMAAFHFLNEVVENDAYQGTNVDPIADLLVFDPLGMLLFESDRVSRFFSDKLHLRDWSTFPAYDPVHRTIENNSDNYSIKVHIPGWKKWSVFYNFGLNGTLGLSYTRENGNCFSGAVGAIAKDRKKVNPEKNDNFLTVDMIWNAGFFYDKNGSLMASLLFSGSRAYKAKVNVFPGVIKVAGVSPGFFLALGQKNEVIFGMCVVPIPLGLAFQNK